jgi:DNA-binding MarR family transcriptional regulator
MKLNTKSALHLWHGALVGTVRHDSPDLSARQMAVLLTVYLADGPHTVRGLSKMLNVSKPAITRALDKLSDLDLLKRKTDEADKRNVLVQRTVKGSVFLNDFAELVRQVADELPDAPAAQAPLVANAA